MDDPNSIASDTSMLILNTFQLLLLYTPMIAVLAYLVWRGYTYIRRKWHTTGMAGGFVEVEDILEHDSDHCHLLTDSNEGGGEVPSSVADGYGSTLDTY